jgi:uncharacterized protein (UPF0332 family)
MNPETEDYLDKARHCLNEAKTVVGARLPDIAAREVYLAAFHAAEAYIFEHTDKAAKTHRGVRSQFNRLAQREPAIARGFLTFLDEGFEFKTIADYGIGPAIDTISTEDAASAIERAGRLIDINAELLASMSGRRTSKPAAEVLPADTSPGLRRSPVWIA